MLRGSNTLFKDIFIEPPVKQDKGRSKDLYASRNECLIDRYCYLAQTTDKRYEAIVKLLSGHFFISEVTVVNVIGEHADKLTATRRDYKELPPAKLQKRLQIKWPHLVWGL
jgi:hypothetical protein